MEFNRATPTAVEVDLNALRHNFQALRQRVGGEKKVLAVVKSNAYGHGLIPVARVLQFQGADLFGVGTVDEGIELREAGIKRPILLLLGMIDGKFPELVRYGLTPVLYDLSTARELQQYLGSRQEVMGVHLKVDTGMTRLGLTPEEAPRFLDEISRMENLKPSGMITHLADADSERFSNQQVLTFERLKLDYQRRFSNGFYHVSSSLAALDKRYRAFDGVRLGIVLYGAYPVERQRRLVSLKPVMRWRSQIVQIKKVLKGTPVSYGRTYVTKKATRIGIVPVGYADGYHRSLSNRSFVLVRGQRVPVVGAVCMDMMMVDLSKVPGARVSDEVVLLGPQGREAITVEEMGKWAGTISYEILCHVALRNPRRYLDSDRR